MFRSSQNVRVIEVPCLCAIQGSTKGVQTSSITLGCSSACAESAVPVFERLRLPQLQQEESLPTGEEL